MGREMSSASGLSFSEAIQAMKSGKRIRHRHFSSDEWMTWENGRILFEDGVRCSVADFLHDRVGDDWNNGYEIINQSTK